MTDKILTHWDDAELRGEIYSVVNGQMVLSVTAESFKSFSEIVKGIRLAEKLSFKSAVQLMRRT